MFFINTGELERTYQEVIIALFKLNDMLTMHPSTAASKVIFLPLIIAF
jgi:hypothetical protein